MTDKCIWAEKEYIIDHFSSEFHYERGCDSKNSDYAENFCPNCGRKVVTEDIDYDKIEMS